MAARFRNVRLAAVLLVAALGAASALPAFAQAPGGAPGESPRGAPGGSQWVQPPTELPPVAHNDPTYNLDTLFAALKIAPDEASAKAIESRIWAVWMISGSDTCALLMNRAHAAVEAKEYDLALKLLDAIIDIKPSFAEAWNQRATIYYLKDDYAQAIADLGEVLAREPRHFGALSGLGLMLQELGDDKDALDAYRKALELDPHLEHIDDVVKTLSVKVEGRKI